MPHTERRDRMPVYVMAGGILLSALVSGALADLALEQRDQEFASASAQAQSAVLARVENSLALLRGTAGLFASQHAEISVGEFRDYVGRLALRERYPGILGLGFARALDAGGEAALALEMRAQGHADFHVWPAPGGAPLRTAITFIEPLDARNRQALGFDMATDPVRRAAMERARDSGTAIASGVVQLVQETDSQRQPGFLIYTPVYARGSSPGTLRDRRVALRGLAYAPIRAGDFLSGAFEHEAQPRVSLAVFLGRTRDPASELYRRGAPPGFSAFSRTSTVTVLGQPWTFAFANPVPLGSVLLLPALAGLFGAGLSGILALLVRRERAAHARAQRALEAERVARGEAERANRMKDDFLATLSHELRTPLHAIIGWASLLRMPRLDPERRLQGIEVVDRNARAQAQLIEDLLDMHRIVAGKLALEMHVMDPATVVDDALRTLRPAMDRKSIALEVEMPTEPLAVRGDPARLGQVVSNLVSNAIKFTPEGGRVRVRLERIDGLARLTIEDNGQGIDPAHTERIFGRFAQADSTAARRHGGLGLGLAIVRQLVELHGGTVRARSDGPGRGSTFTVDLPVVTDDATAERRSLARAPADLLQGIDVLAVDDEPDSLELARTALTTHGATVRIAANAAEALDLFRATPPDVLLADIGMPGMDGHALIREVRRMPAPRGGRVPAAAITAYAREVDREQSLEAGFDAHLTKPVRAEELVIAVAGLVATRASEREARG